MMTKDTFEMKNYEEKFWALYEEVRRLWNSLGNFRNDYEQRKHDVKISYDDQMIHSLSSSIFDARRRINALEAKHLTSHHQHCPMCGGKIQ